MRREFRECLNKNKLTRFPSGPRLVVKEIRSASDDLEDAKLGLTHGRAKWSTIQAYYSMFHGARALLYSRGYREKSHYCLEVALRELFVDRSILEGSFVNAFASAMRLRESADYRDDYSEEGAIALIETASSFLDKVKRILST